MNKDRKQLQPDLETILPILIGAWRRLHKLPGPPERLQTREFRSVVSAITALQEQAWKGKSLMGQSYFDSPDLLGAYILYQWVLHYLEGLSLIGELPQSPKRVLDLCSGPAAFAFAALRHGAQEVVAVDKSLPALSIGAEICARYGVPLSIRQGDCLKNGGPVEGKFDLIIAGYCLEELFSPTKKGWEQEQNSFIQKMLTERLTEDGFLLLVDRSHLEMNHRVLKLRDALVSAGVPIQAPCVWKGQCPALKAQKSPCFAQREFEKPHLIKELQRAGSINLSSLKMTYLIFRHPRAGWPKLQDEKLYRVISPPVDSFMGKRYYLCGTDGKKTLGTHLQAHPAASRAFEYLRRGELISISQALEKQNALDIVQDTTVKVAAACGKPLQLMN